MRNTEFTANVQLQPATVQRQQPLTLAVTGKCGNTSYPLGEQIASTVEVHGVAWASAYYASKGVALEHFLLLARGAGALQ